MGSVGLCLSPVSQKIVLNPCSEPIEYILHFHIIFLKSRFFYCPPRYTLGFLRLRISVRLSYVMCSVRDVHVAFLDVMTLVVTKLVLVTFFHISHICASFTCFPRHWVISRLGKEIQNGRTRICKMRVFENGVCFCGQPQSFCIVILLLLRVITYIYIV